MILRLLATVVISALFLGGCAARKCCLPPDRAKVDEVFQHAETYAHDLWVSHYSTDESKVPGYTLPPITSRTAGEWETRERPRILALFKECMYGRMPPHADSVKLKLLAQKNDALDGLAIRKEYRVFCRNNNGKEFDFDMLVYIPKGAKTPVPVFTGLNFSGNQCNTPELDVRMTRGMYMDYSQRRFLPLKKRAQNLESWNYKEAMKRGYAVATACYWEICPDYLTGLKLCPFTMFYNEKEMRLDHEISMKEQKSGKVFREVSIIGAWAWGLSCMLDALEQEPLVDAGRAAVIGHSRLGKAALWAGACDTRFKLVISNNSGCGGAALSRRRFGETMEIIYWDQRSWYTGKLALYARDIDMMPVDQHMLLALVAPRALYVASATEDLNADPKGEFLSAVEASKVWKLYGYEGLDAKWMPQPDTTVGKDRVGYHIRNGKHAITARDWSRYYDFADKVLK